MAENDRKAAESTRAPLQDVRTILVFACNLLGDSICRLPAIQAAKETYPGGRVYVVVAPTFREVFEGQAFIDEVWPLSRGGGGLSQALAWLKLIVRARRVRPDLVLDLYGSKRTALASRLSGARFRTGLFRDGRSGAYNLGQLIDPRSLHDGHIIQRVNEAVAPAGITARFAYCPLPVGDDQRAAALAVLAQLGIESGDRLVVLNPSARVAAKRWPTERFGKLAQSVAGRSRTRCVVVAAPGQSSITQEVVSFAAGGATALPEMALSELAAVLERADLLVTGDTGTLHMGAAMGTPCLILAGPTDPKLSAYPGGRQIVLFHRESCEEWKDGDQCGLYNTCQCRRCINAISVDEAAEAVQRLLRA